MREQIYEKLDELWNEFYAYGWCDTQEDRDKFNAMYEKIRQLIDDVIDSVTRSMEER